MSLEEIRKFLRERGLDAVPSGGGTSFSDYMSWSPENLQVVQFLGGNFPEGITTIIANFGSEFTSAKFSDAFIACVTVDLSNSNVSNLTIPASTQALLLDSTTASTLVCTFPNGLLTLSIANASYTSLPALPASLVTLEATGSSLATLPPVAGTSLQTLHVSNSGLSDLPPLPNTLVTLQAAVINFPTVPTLPVSCIHIDFGDCSFTAAKTNNVLAQLVANGAHNGTVSMLGSDAAPTGQGLTDKATLIARGWTVTTH